MWTVHKLKTLNMVAFPPSKNLVFHLMLISSSVTNAAENGEFLGSHLILNGDFTLCFRVLFNKMSSGIFGIAGSKGPHQRPSLYRWDIGPVAIPCYIDSHGNDLTIIKLHIILAPYYLFFIR